MKSLYNLCLPTNAIKIRSWEERDSEVDSTGYRNLKKTLLTVCPLSRAKTGSCNVQQFCLTNIAPFVKVHGDN